MSVLSKSEPFSAFPHNISRHIRYVFSDLDDTITTHGRLLPETYQAVCDLTQAGIKVIVVTGGPGGWCDCIARMWPVFAVVGESGSFYMHKDSFSKRILTREFVLQIEREAYINRLSELKGSVLRRFPGICLSSDQFSRIFDLAIEIDSICDPKEIGNCDRFTEVVEYLIDQGLTVKTSSIHINAHWGNWDKLSSTRAMIRELMNKELEDIVEESAFIGDSLNDETMFEFFKHTVGVSNIANFESFLVHRPKWVTNADRGAGFAEFANILLS